MRLLNSDDRVVALVMLLAVAALAVAYTLWRRRQARGLFSQYSEDSRRAIFYAVHICAAMGEHSITPIHLLLGVLMEDRGLAERAIGAEHLDRIVEQIESLLGDRKRSIDGIPLDASSKIVVGQYAPDMAHGEKCTTIASRHLLQGIMHLEAFEAAALQRFGLDVATIRGRISDLQPRTS